MTIVTSRDYAQTSRRADATNREVKDTLRFDPAFSTLITPDPGEDDPKKM